MYGAMMMNKWVKVFVLMGSVLALASCFCNNAGV